MSTPVIRGTERHVPLSHMVLKRYLPSANTSPGQLRLTCHPVSWHTCGTVSLRWAGVSRKGSLSDNDTFRLHVGPGEIPRHTLGSEFT